MKKVILLISVLLLLATAAYADVIYDPDGYSNPNNINDGNPATFALFASPADGNKQTSIGLIIDTEIVREVYTKVDADITATGTIRLQGLKGSTWETISILIAGVGSTTISAENTTQINDYYNAFRVNFTTTGASTNHRLYEINYTTTIAPNDINVYFPLNDTGLVNETGGVEEIVQGLNGTYNGLNYSEVINKTYLSDGPAGQINQSFRFDGINDYISIPDNSALDLVEDFTISFWIKPNNCHLGAVMSKDDLSSKPDGSYYIGVGCSIEPKHTMGFSYRQDNGSSYSLHTPYIVENGVWTHYVLTTNSTHYRQYLDKNIQPSNLIGETGEKVNLSVNAKNLLLGANDESGLERFYNGSIDDVQIYNISLEQYEIDFIYYDGLGENPGRININITDIVNESYLPFNATFTSGLNSYTVSSTNGTATISLPNGTYNYTIDSYGYFDITNTTTIEAGIVSYLNLSMYDLNKLIINFRDEDTLEYMDGIVFEIFSEYYTNKITTSTSNYTLTDLADGTYQIRYGLDNTTLRPRSYYLEMPLTRETNLNITLYTINESISNLFVRTLRDQNYIPYSQGYLEVQRPYTTNGSAIIYRTVEIANIDSQGNAVFSAIPNTQQYRFRILNSGFAIADTKNPAYLIDTSSEIEVEEDIDFLEAFDTAYGVVGSLYYQNTTQYFIYDYSNASSVDLIELEVIWRYGKDENITTVTGSDPSGTLTVFATNNTNGTYTATVYATVGRERYFIAQEIVNFRFSDTNTKEAFRFLGTFLLVLMLIVFATMTEFKNPAPSIICAIGALLAWGVGFLNLIEVSLALMGGVFILGIIVLSLTKN